MDTVPCGGDTAPTLGAVEAVSLTVPAQGQLQQSVQFPSSLLTTSVCGATVHFWGSTAAGAKAQTSVVFERPAQMAAAVPVSDTMNALLNYLVQRNLVSSTGTITEDQISQLYRQRKIRYNSATSSFYQTQTPPTATSGSQCDPDNPGTPPTGGSYSCQPTGKWAVDSPGWVAGAHIANALKGDAIMDRNCSGPVTSLLGALNPPQKYTHTGMMTKNYVEVRQSYGETNYLMNHPNGVAGQPTNGFQEHALRYLWPGTITNSVDEAFSGGAGRQLSDPDGNSYAILGFAPDQVRCNGDANVIYPRVVKPAPENEALVRPRLQQAADLSKNIGGHYRFYEYSNAEDTAASDPNGPQSTPEPNNGSGFGAGNPMYGPVPTVCSAFVRFALKAAGADLDKDKNLPQPSSVTNNPPEGIFYYSPGDRLAAANALYSCLYNDVQYQIAQLQDKADAYWWIPAAVAVGSPLFPELGLVGAVALSNVTPIVEWATDAPDHVASQITNCFASDYCAESANGSDNWKNPGAGFAVSPDNILNNFDAPSAASPNAVYGYNEQMKYRGKRYSQIFEWKPAAGTRPVCGTVFKGNAPAPNAQVEVQGIDGASQVTDANGQFCFDAIPSGNISVHAWATYADGSNQDLWEGFSCYVPDSASSNEWVSANCQGFAITNSTPTSSTNVTLLPPETQYRLVTIQGLITSEDAECATDDHILQFPYFRTCTVGPHDGEQVASLEEMGDADTCNDHVGVRIDGTCTLQPGGNGTVAVQLTMTLDVGDENSCGGNQAAGFGGAMSAFAPPNKTVSVNSDGMEPYANGSCGVPPFGWSVTNSAIMSQVTLTNVVAN